MSYSAMHNNPQRLGVIGAVALLHGVAVVALITGLAGVITGPPKDHGTEATNIPLAPPPSHPVRHPHINPQPHTQPPTGPQLTPPLFHPIEVGPTPPLPTGPDLAPPHPLPRTAPSQARAAAPRGAPSGWASEEDYPARDQYEGHEGTARFSLSIGTDGRVNGCVIVASSGWAGLDAATCRLVTGRARFTPALDEDGHVAAGSYAGSIRWELPR